MNEAYLVNDFWLSFCYICDQGFARRVKFFRQFFGYSFDNHFGMRFVSLIKDISFPDSSDRRSVSC